MSAVNNVLNNVSNEIHGNENGDEFKYEITDDTLVNLLEDLKERHEDYDELCDLYRTNPLLKSTLDLKVEYEALIDRAEKSNPVIPGHEFTRRRVEISRCHPDFPNKLDPMDWLNQALFMFHIKDNATTKLMNRITKRYGEEKLDIIRNYHRVARKGAEMDIAAFHAKLIQDGLPTTIYTEPCLNPAVLKFISMLQNIHIKVVSEEPLG